MLDPSLRMKKNESLSTPWGPNTNATLYDKNQQFDLEPSEGSDHSRHAASDLGFSRRSQNDTDITATVDDKFVISF